MGLRVHGLIGDCIKATTVLSELIKEDPTRTYVFLISYKDETKGSLIKDIFSDLIAKGLIVGLFLNNYQIVGNMSFLQWSFLRDLGCDIALDLYFHSSDEYKRRKTGIAYLGFEQPQSSPTKVALFRYSGFHQHVPLRHIPEKEWLEIEDHLLNLGLDVHLYGQDDTMRTLVKPDNDFRKKLSVLGTIKHSADSGLCISTTTFLPHYLSHFIPCLVFCDPIDIPALCLQWRSNHNFMPIDTTKVDHVSYVKEFASRWYLANTNAISTMRTLVEALSKQPVNVKTTSSQLQMEVQ
jgi:hypothetical protein